MKNWLVTFCIILLFGVDVDAAATEKAPFYQMKSGETLSGRFGPHTWPKICQLNKELGNIKEDCNLVRKGQWLQLPENVGGAQVVYKHVTSVKSSVTEPALPAAEPGVFRWVKVGGAPLYDCGKRNERLVNEEAWRELGLTDEEQSEVRWRVAFQRHSNTYFRPGDRFEAVAFCKSGHVAFERNVLAAWDKDVVVLARTYVLKSGRALHWVRNCNNWVVGQPLPPVAPPTPRQEPPIELTPKGPVPVVDIPAPTPVPVVSEPPEVEQIAREYDWDASLFVGGDKDVRYAGGEGAGYPFIRHTGWGRYALGGGGSFSLWNGGTPDGFRYSGETAAFGLAQKFSFTNRRDLGIKFPMIGGLWERGHDATGKYQQSRNASLWCASANYTDASREKAGEKVLPEWAVWASLCNPFSQSATHSWDGKTLSAKPEAVKYMAGVGARVFLTDKLGDTGLLAQVQPFVEVGVNKTAPNPSSGHAYVGLRGIKKVWGIGVGPHWSNLGETLGATLTYDLGRDIKLRIQAERWNAMIRAVEALGVAVD